MNNLIPVKNISKEGVVSIKNGIKPNINSKVEVERKPDWIRLRLKQNRRFSSVKSQVEGRRLNTVCEEAMCPNINECWNNGTATFMLLGSVCTRACKFCSVDTGNPRGRLDELEPDNVAKSIEEMRVKYVVLTSVNRDDLDDGGAGHFSNTIRAIKRRTPDVDVEALCPDFKGDLVALKKVLSSGLQVFAQNLETVKRLTQPVRDPRAGYEQTLFVLEESKKLFPKVITKTSLMLGLGETHEEVITSIKDIRDSGVDVLTLGQYMRPTKNHLPVKKWIRPSEFEELKYFAESLGFMMVFSGPLVRSSYRADLLQKYLIK